MPRPHISMRKIRDVLRLSLHEGLSLRQVGRLGAACRSRRWPTTSAAPGRPGLSWPLPEGLDDDALEARLFASAAPPRRAPPAAGVAEGPPRAAPARA